MHRQEARHPLLTRLHAAWTGAFLTGGLFAQQNEAPMEGGVPPLPHPDVPPPPEVPVPVNHWPLIGLISLAVVVFTVLIVFLVKGVRRQAKQSPPPLEHAHQRLRELLRQTESIHPAETAHRVSVIVREYFEARYGTPAPRRTREEIYEGEAPATAPDPRPRFENVALECDRVAFGKEAVTKEIADSLVKSAVEALRHEAYAPPETATAR